MEGGWKNQVTNKPEREKEKKGKGKGKEETEERRRGREEGREERRKEKGGNGYVVNQRSPDAQYDGESPSALAYAVAGQRPWRET